MANVFKKERDAQRRSEEMGEYAKKLEEILSLLSIDIFPEGLQQFSKLRSEYTPIKDKLLDKQNIESMSNAEYLALLDEFYNVFINFIFSKGEYSEAEMENIRHMDPDDKMEFIKNNLKK